MKHSSRPFFRSSTKVFSSFLCSVLMLGVSSSPHLWAQATPPGGGKHFSCTDPAPGQRGIHRNSPDGSCQGGTYTPSFQGSMPAGYGSFTVTGCSYATSCCRETAEGADFCNAPSASAENLRSILGDAPIVVSGPKGPVQVWGPEGKFELKREDRAVGMLVLGAIILGIPVAIGAISSAAIEIYENGLPDCISFKCSNGHSLATYGYCMVTGAAVNANLPAGTVLCGNCSACN